MRMMIFLRYSLLLGSMLFLVAAQARAAVTVFEHGPRGSKKVALTFDACPTGREDEYDERVVEVLVKEAVPATLFMSGRWVEKNSDTAKSLAANPQFEIANHAFWHPHMREKDDERILRELKRTQDIIRKVTGKRPEYFRPPFGEVDDRLARLAADAGLVTVQYDIASGDPDPGLSAKRIVRGVVGNAKGGSIVVFHMNENGPRTAEVLPEIIRQLREKGFELVTVGEMLKTANRGTGRSDAVLRKSGDREKGKERSEGTRSTVTVSTVTVTTPAEGPASEVTATGQYLHSSGEMTIPVKEK